MLSGRSPLPILPAPPAECAVSFCWVMSVRTCQNTRYMVYIYLNCVHLVYLLGFQFRILCRTSLHQATQYLQGILVANLVLNSSLCVSAQGCDGVGLPEVWDELVINHGFRFFHLLFDTFENLCFIEISSPLKVLVIHILWVREIMSDFLPCH